MSISSTLVTIAGTIEDILLRQGRSIGGIIPNVIIEEDHTDEMTITQHPVETGADITDHAFKQPAQLTMRCGWSQSGGNTPFVGFFSPSPKDVYDQLLALQATRKPFDVVTGKRSYKNMLLKRISVVTDGESENCLLVDADLQEVILVDTSATTTNVTSGNPQNLASQAANGPLVTTGTQQLRDVTGTNTDAQLADFMSQVP